MRQPENFAEGPRSISSEIQWLQSCIIYWMPLRQSQNGRRRRCDVKAVTQLPAQHHVCSFVSLKAALRCCEALPVGASCWASLYLFSLSSSLPLSVGVRLWACVCAHARMRARAAAAAAAVSGDVTCSSARCLPHHCATWKADFDSWRSVHTADSPPTPTKKCGLNSIWSSLCHRIRLQYRVLFAYAVTCSQSGSTPRYRSTQECRCSHSRPHILLSDLFDPHLTV